MDVTSIDLAEAKECWHCKRLTYAFSLKFKVHLCPGRCTDRKLDEYLAYYARMADIHP